MTDQQIIKEQYSRPQNLEARINLHERFSTNKHGWHRWVFDQFAFHRAGRILELGCGVGQLWLDNIGRVRAGWDVTLSDFSEAMLRKAIQNLAGSGLELTYRVIDAGNIPYADGQFDAVIANHMLYYVEQKQHAFAEIHRVLKPGGLFYASTVGEQHLKELTDLMAAFDTSLGFHDRTVDSFTLENGADQVAEWFEEVRVLRYVDGLRVTDAAALIGYVFSSTSIFDLPTPRKAELAQFIEQEVASKGGVFEIKKDSGLIWGERGAPN